MGLPLLATQGRLTPLGIPPDWSRLDSFQHTITRERFASLLDGHFAPGGAWKDVMEVGAEAAVIQTRRGQPPYTLLFARSAQEAKPAPRFWRRLAELPPAPPSKPLHGLKITIDPGHIGGRWAKMEERWFQLGKAEPVREGDMTLLVAKKLKPKLEAMGAVVSLTRSKAEPTTADRPSGLRAAAAASLRDRGRPVTQETLRKESERLFYRVSEIRQRAQLVNTKLQPDLVLCLHFNAEPWGDENRPRLVSENHLHFLVTGAWSAEELSYEDQRLEMLLKLLTGAAAEEISVSATLARVMAARTGLPPYTYRGNSALNVQNHPYLWARNLLANRLFNCPVIYIEPYVMNSHEVHERIQAGDYRGLRQVAGKLRPSLYEEYAEAVAAGLAAHYSQRGQRRP